MKSKFHTKIENTSNRIIVHMNPKFELLPLPITRFDDPFLPFSKEIISATGDIVAGYLFDFASYLVMGGAGVVALERAIAYVPDNCVTILHAPFTGTGYSPMADATGFNLDAITVATHNDLQHYTENIPYMAFLADDASIPDRGGIYHKGELVFKQDDVVTRLSLTTDDILYTSKLDNFAQKVREGIQTLQ